MAIFELHTVIGSSDVLLSTTTGSGFPALYEQSALYIYRWQNSLKVSTDGGFSFQEIKPSSFFNVKAMAQTATQTVVIGGISGNAEDIKYQPFPETQGGWLDASGNTPTAYNSSDAIGSSSITRGILVGGAHVGGASETIRVVRAVDAPPYPNWIESDTGLPQSGRTSIITDLDAYDA